MSNAQTYCDTRGGLGVNENAGIIRREVAILYGDVVGYSRLMDFDETRTFARLRDCMNHHWRPLIQDHGGKIVGTGGDSMFVEFAQADQAADCATQIQSRMQEVNEGLDDSDRFVLRIGVNFGEVMDSGDDLFGAVVNVAARLQELTEPGGVLIAESVLARLSPDKAEQFSPAGSRRLKNIADPVPVHRWRRGAPEPLHGGRMLAVASEAAAGLASGLGRLFRRTARSTPRAKEAAEAAGHLDAALASPGVMVMPFAVLGQTPDDQILANGMTEEIITMLGQQANLRTLSRGDSFAHRHGTDAGAAEMRERYGVGYLLEGSTRQAQQEFLCTVRLLETETEQVVWTERYRRPLADVFDVQLEIAERVALAIQSTVTRQEGFRIRSRPPDNLAAWQLVVQANHELFERMNSASLHRAEELLRAAVATDPDYADAWALLALTIAGEVAGGYAKDPEARDIEAISLADAALDMAPNDATVLGNVAAAKAHLGHGQEGLRLIERALQLAPHYTPFHQTKAVALAQSNRPKEAIPILERIVEASPHDLQRHMNLFILAVAYAASGRRADAMATAQKAIELDPTWHQPHIFIAMMSGMQGKLGVAAAKFAEGRQLEPELTLTGYEYFFKKSSAPITKPMLMLVRKLWRDSDRLLAEAA
ncbi:adenylate/guanylate cyclase domain-containing protein [Marimonas sp. MJW-29]|uniref:Adenylate/guanylate cyclase domain-containing protein n=1 Tax=Sulfitobacter sediminis TaxID=3234186 RepID=A0ABV3RNU9_9RHOB